MRINGVKQRKACQLQSPFLLLGKPSDSTAGTKRKNSYLGVVHMLAATREQGCGLWHGIQLLCSWVLETRLLLPDGPVFKQVWALPLCSGLEVS